jgi:hypothetical protein
MSQATHATPAAFFEALLNTLVSFQPKTQRNTNHQRVERLAPGLWNHFPSVQPPVAQRTIRCRNMDVPAAARERESDESNFTGKRATDQQVIVELRMLCTERTIRGVTEVVPVAAFRGSA